MPCNLKNVLSSGANCQENPAGLANYMYIVPLTSDFVTRIGVHDGANCYVITPKAGGGLKGFRLDFKSQTGQITAEHNGGGKAWTVTGTFRVEKNEDDMAYMSRVLSNMDGKFLAFFPTGKVTDRGIEWVVVGNQFGDNEISVASDSGAQRGDDHGQTVTISCNYQVYDIIKWYGDIDTIDDSSFDISDSSGDDIGFGNTFSVGFDRRMGYAAAESGYYGDNELHVGDVITLVATPYTGYNFLRWSDGSTQNPYEYVYPGGSVRMRAIFAWQWDDSSGDDSSNDDSSGDSSGDSSENPK